MHIIHVCTCSYMYMYMYLRIKHLYLGAHYNDVISLVSNCVKIEDRKLEWKAESRIGSLENARHKAGGGDKKVFTSF